MNKLAALWVFILLTLLFFTDTGYAVTTEALKVPLKTLKTEVFDWLFVIKVAAIAVGGMFAAAKQSLTPFGIGAGISVGIHAFDKIIGDASAALI